MTIWVRIESKEVSLASMFGPKIENKTIVEDAGLFIAIDVNSFTANGVKFKAFDTSESEEYHSIKEDANINDLKTVMDVVIRRFRK